jgi:hypothetical protein
MEKKPIVILFICSAIGFLIFFLLWMFVVLFPFIEWAQLMSDLGITYGGTVWDILELLFLDVYFYGMIVCGVLTLIFRLIGWKALKSN